MSAKNPQQDASRRRFLKGMVIGGSVASVAGGSSVLAATHSPAPAKAEGDDLTKRKGYQETAHVRRFYDLARS